MHSLVIPGLAMTAAEMPPFEGAVAFDNPELGKGEMLDREYSITDAADSIARAAAAYVEHARRPFDRLVGMSMGGMVAATLMARHPHLFTGDAPMLFLTTSANTPQNPAVTPELMAEFQVARPGDVASFKLALARLFSTHFYQQDSDTLQKYIAYRAFGKNGQSGKAYFRQVKALSQFDGSDIFPKLDASRCHFVHGGDDRVFGVKHREDLAQLLPKAKFTVVENVGHMLNLEMPELFAL